MGPSANGPPSLIFPARASHVRGANAATEVKILPLRSPQKPVLPPPLHLLPQRRNTREEGGPFPVQPEHISLCSRLHRLFVVVVFFKQRMEAENSKGGG